MTNATMYHVNRVGTADLPRQYSTAISNSTLRVTALSRRPIGLTFPAVTPSNVTLRIASGAIGDYVVYALPYPAGTTFVVTTQSGSIIAPAGSVDALTVKNSYLYDRNSQHLFVLVSETYAVGSNRTRLQY